MLGLPVLLCGQQGQAEELIPAGPLRKQKGTVLTSPLTTEDILAVWLLTLLQILAGITVCHNVKGFFSSYLLLFHLDSPKTRWPTFDKWKAEKSAVQCQGNRGKSIVQRITSHSARTFSECEPRPAFAPKTCASWFQPHEIPGLSRSQFLLTVFLRNPVTFKGVDWKRQPRTQQLLPWALYTCWKKRKTCNLPREFGETKASVEEASSVFLREHSSSAFSLWFQRASEEKSVWPEPGSVFHGEGKWGFWLLLRLDFCCSKEEICC